MNKSLEECLGWHEDWPDGSASYKVWFDWNDRRMDASPSTDYLVRWVTNNVRVLSITYIPDTSPVWVAIFLDKDYKAQTVKSTDHRKMLVGVVFAAAGEG